MTNLAIAVLVGIIVASLSFAWRKSQNIGIEISMEKSEKKYSINGPLFFASTTNFKKFFDYKNDPKNVTIDFIGSRVCDYSAIKAIKQIIGLYEKYGKKVKLVHLSKDCRRTLHVSGDIAQANIDDPTYTVPKD
jgi:SulP family sulfate permease